MMQLRHSFVTGDIMCRRNDLLGVCRNLTGFGVFYKRVYTRTIDEFNTYGTLPRAQDTNRSRNFANSKYIR